jgi:preprotein translocase subunit SecG
MVVFPLVAVGLIMKAIAVLFVTCAVVLVLVVLIQKGRGGGLSAAFGGAMASGLLGSRTGDFLTWVTVVLVGVFLMLAVVMAKFYKPTVSDFGAGQRPPVRREQRQPPPTERPSTVDEVGSGGGDAGEGTDANSLSLR